MCNCDGFRDMRGTELIILFLKRIFDIFDRPFVMKQLSTTILKYDVYLKPALFNHINKNKSRAKCMQHLNCYQV